MYDDDTRRAITAVELEGDTRIEQWFNAICAAVANTDGSWNAVRNQLYATAADFDSAFDGTFIERFALTVDRLGDPTRTMAELDRIGISDLARAYPTLLAAQAAVGAAPGADRTTLDWLTDAQRGKLEAGLGSTWAAALTTALEDKYPPWRGATTDGLQGFVDDWSDVIIAGARRTPGPPPNAGALEWVTDAQRDKLQHGLGEIWPEFVRTTLDREYPVWRSARVEDLVQFLTSWSDHIIAEHVPAAPPPPPVEDAATLSWITAAQQEKLQRGLGGIWPEFVRTTLDREYPQWQAAPTGDLVTFLTGWSDHIIATHVPPAPPPPPVEVPVADAPSGAVAAKSEGAPGSTAKSGGTAAVPELDDDDAAEPAEIDLAVLQAIVGKFDSGDLDLTPEEADAFEALGRMPGITITVEDISA
ncbi:hypothetical protein OG474_43905 [Kribbella sp. NBC_01505]|uniref:hypothetical protein n=1 Tax=Kribbella sp. NBC_01505 TaxID=2903580 RepID=UPI00386FFD47